VFFRQPSDRDQSVRQPWNRQAPWSRPRYPYGGYRGDGNQTRPLPRQPTRPRSYSRWDEDRETTRYLSARTQLFISYADYVVREIVNEHFRALAPAYGVDLAAVAKWAIGSLHRRRRRDLAAVKTRRAPSTSADRRRVAMGATAVLRSVPAVRAQS
jgi:hypothetical protein